MGNATPAKKTTAAPKKQSTKKKPASNAKKDKNESSGTEAPEGGVVTAHDEDQMDEKTRIGYWSLRPTFRKSQGMTSRLIHRRRKR